MKKFILLLTVCTLFTGCSMTDNKNHATQTPGDSPISSPLNSSIPDILPEITDGVMPEHTQAPGDSTNTNPNSIGQ